YIQANTILIYKIWSIGGLHRINHEILVMHRMPNLLPHKGAANIHPVMIHSLKINIPVICSFVYHSRTLHCHINPPPQPLESDRWYSYPGFQEALTRSSH